MGIGNILLRGNPAMDWDLIQGGGRGGEVATSLSMLHAKETRKSSGPF